MTQEAKPTPGQEYEQRAFADLSLAGNDLCRITFRECAFRHCQLTGARLADCKLQRVRFEGCKLQGLDFSQCDRFLLKLCFKDCLLFSCAFAQMDLQQTVYQDCRLRECDFLQTDLRKAEFPGCTLPGSVFRDCNLSGADFRGATEYQIDPARNKLKKAKFSYPDVLGLLHGLEIEIS